MSKTKHHARELLKAASEQLVSEVFSGAWDEKACLENQPLIDNPVLIAHLESMCPGHKKDEYIGAFSRAVQNNR